MTLFIVRLEHPDEEGWQHWVQPHGECVRDQVSAGTIIASGPSVGTGVRQGWLIMQSLSERELRQLLTTDPFWKHETAENVLDAEAGITPAWGATGFDRRSRAVL